MTGEDRWRIRQEKAAPLTTRCIPGCWPSTTLRPKDRLSPKRWTVLTRYIEDDTVPIDNNAVENQRRSWALGCSNWLFAWPLRSGKRSATIISLIQSARMNEHNPYCLSQRCADAAADAAGK
ncbi:transposase [Pseudomonas sp. B21-048]|uniref:IS66 family transposase n=1 Tax=Pseudomonas sp. B21-048 TaxID=2895490 RepID=UPI0038D436C5